MSLILKMWSTKIMGEGQVIDSGHVLCVGGLELSVGGFYSLSRASTVFVFLCCTRVFSAFGAEGAAANKGVMTLRAFGAPP